MVWINLATFVAVLIVNQLISQLDTNKTRNLNRLTYIEKCGQTQGQQKTTLPKENNLPHGEVKSESENP